MTSFCILQCKDEKSEELILVSPFQRSPLESLILKTKIFEMGEPKALLALALSPPNLDDIERTILSLKEVCDLYGNSLLPCMLYLVTVLLKLVLKEAETNRSLV